MYTVSWCYFERGNSGYKTNLKTAVLTESMLVALLGNTNAIVRSVEEVRWEPI